MLFMNNSNKVKIPVVLASDENYAPYLFVTMYSAIQNKADNSIYDFYILVPNKFSNNCKKLFKNLETSTVFVNFVDMNDMFQSSKTTIKHITYPTYYRLLLAELLPDYDKVLYLDTDVIVLKDLKSLYDYDLNENYIAGVKAAAYILNEKTESLYYKSIGLPELSGYINAGVTLWNIKKIRDDNITPGLISLVDENFKSQDQDIINVVFYGRILFLDFSFNVMTKYLSGKYAKNDLYDIYGKDVFECGLKNPCIIHYADKRKPWRTIFIPYGIIWWKYALLAFINMKMGLRFFLTILIRPFIW